MKINVGFPQEMHWKGISCWDKGSYQLIYTGYVKVRNGMRTVLDGEFCNGVVEVWRINTCFVCQRHMNRSDIQPGYCLWGLR